MREAGQDSSVLPDERIRVEEGSSAAGVVSDLDMVLEHLRHGMGREELVSSPRPSTSSE